MQGIPIREKEQSGEHRWPPRDLVSAEAEQVAFEEVSQTLSKRPVVSMGQCTSVQYGLLLKGVQSQDLEVDILFRVEIVLFRRPVHLRMLSTSGPCPRRRCPDSRFRSCAACQPYCSRSWSRSSGPAGCKEKRQYLQKCGAAVRTDGRESPGGWTAAECVWRRLWAL